MFALVYSVGYLVFLFLHSLADTCDMTSLCSRESPFRHFTYKGLVTPFEYFTVGLVYGLRRSPLLWQREPTQTIRKLGFQPIPHEPCCFIQGGIILFFYVDDTVIAFWKHQEAEARSLIEKLQGKYKLTGGEILQWFLGIEILRDRKRGIIWLVPWR